MPVIRIPELRKGVDGSTDRIAVEVDDRHLVDAGDLLFSWSGSIVVTKWPGPKGVLNQHIFRVVARPGVNQVFLRYLLESLIPVFQGLVRDQATSMGHVKVADLRRLTVQLPPIEEQQPIATVLSALDDKIELNRGMNETLAALAQAIFTSWFINFDPVRARAEGRDPLGMDAKTAALFPDSFDNSSIGAIPSGWLTTRLTDVAMVHGGSTPRRSEPTYWGPGHNWFSMSDLPATRSDCYVVATRETITPAGLTSVSAQPLPTGATIVTARGTVGETAMAGVPIVINQSCYALEHRQRADTWLFFLTRSLVDQMRQRSHGSVFQTITRNTLDSLTVAGPPPELVAKYEAFVTPLMQRVLTNLEETSMLRQTRDFLLPALVDGKVRVPPPINDASHAQ